MIERIEVKNELEEVLRLPFGPGEEGFGFFVSDINGLDPTPVNLVTTTFASLDGDQKQASRREARELQVTIAFELGAMYGSVDSRRKLLYRYFMPKKMTTLHFLLRSGQRVSISGEVVEFAMPRMTQTPEATIRIHCYNPDFLGDELREFVNHSLSIGQNFPTPIEYYGDVPSGFVLTVQPSRNIESFQLAITNPSGVTETLYFEQAIAETQTLVLSTVPGEKGAWDGLQGGRSRLQGVTFNSHWLQLEPGVSQILMTVLGLPIEYKLAYWDRYGGI